MRTAVALLALTAPLLAQEVLTLRQAAQVAIEKNPLRKAAIADTKVASAEVREARSFLIPHLSFSETATRGNDPVYVFGSKLRQQRFAAADFSLNQLNSPLPFGNFTTRFGGTWNLFDSFASWHGVKRAKQMNEAAAHQLDRTDQEIVFRVVSAYYHVLLARKQLEVAEQSVKTAGRSRAQPIEIDSGLVVESICSPRRFVAGRQESIRARNDLSSSAPAEPRNGMPADSSFSTCRRSRGTSASCPVLAEVEKQAL